MTADATPVDPLPASGWRVADVLPRPLVEGLAEHLRPTLPERLGSFHATTVHADRNLAREVDAELKRLVGPYLRVVLPDHEIFLASVIAKGAETTDPVAFHQDWTFTDERTERCVLCWIPLVDTDAASGALRVVEGSHRRTAGVRPSGRDLETDPLPPDQQERADRVAVTVDMRAGQGLIYDAALLHGSGPNAAGHDRLVVNLALRRRGADLFHFHVGDDRELRGHRVDTGYFTGADFGTEPVGYPDVTPWTGPITAAETGAALDPAAHSA